MMTERSKVVCFSRKQTSRLQRITFEAKHRLILTNEKSCKQEMESGDAWDVISKEPASEEKSQAASVK